MKIVVTGAAGFIGRALVTALLADGHDLIALDLAAAAPSRDRLRTVAGDLADPSVRADLLAAGCDAVVHLATVPGAAAEADPAESRRINVTAMYDLLEDLGDRAAPRRFVYASSIAVLGDPLPPAGVDDATPLAPRLVYGGHKAMMETAVAVLSRRGEIDGVTLRLPGILARPKGSSGLKSAFMSDLFHALRASQRFICPVSPRATIWAQSVAQCVANLRAALTVDSASFPPTRAVTLPALRIEMAALADEIARQCGVSAGLVDYRPDAALEAAFGTHPILATPAAERAGFRHDGSLPVLVARALAQ